MTRFLYTSLLLLAAVALPAAARAQDKTLRLDDWVYEPNIRSVQLYILGQELSFPTLALNSSDQLVLCFDELGTAPSDLYVSLQHCTWDWQPSQLQQIEYMEGYMEDQITEYGPSRSTLVFYHHYRYAFPHSNLRMKVSGNYILKVYRNYDKDDLVLTRRFIVTEDLVRVGSALGLSQGGQRFKTQQINFDLMPTGLTIYNPADLRVGILQNFRWDNARWGLQPLYYNRDKLEYRFDHNNDFPGGNEFRWVDLRSARTRVGRIERFEYSPTATTAVLYPEAPRQNNTYQSEPDFNGFFWIGVREFPDADYEADYLRVTFRLKMPPLPASRDVYLLGRFTDWRIQPMYKLDYKDGAYTASIFLKQGIYNYHFVTWDGATMDEAELEGTHYETENYYTVLAYYRYPTDRYDRLVALRHINFYGQP